MKTNTYTFTNRAMAIVIAVMLMVMTFVSAIPVSAASRLDTTETVSFTANCDKSGYTSSHTFFKRDFHPCVFV